MAGCPDRPASERRRAIATLFLFSHPHPPRRWRTANGPPATATSRDSNGVRASRPKLRAEVVQKPPPEPDPCNFGPSENLTAGKRVLVE